MKQLQNAGVEVVPGGGAGEEDGQHGSAGGEPEREQPGVGAGAGVCAMVRCGGGQEVEQQGAGLPQQRHARHQLQHFPPEAAVEDGHELGACHSQQRCQQHEAGGAPETRPGQAGQQGQRQAVRRGGHGGQHEHAGRGDAQQQHCRLLAQRSGHGAADERGDEQLGGAHVAAGLAGQPSAQSQRRQELARPRQQQRDVKSAGAAGGSPFAGVSREAVPELMQQPAHELEAPGVDVVVAAVVLIRRAVARVSAASTAVASCF